MTALVQLVPVPGHLLTSYGPGARTRDSAKRPWPSSALARVEKFGGTGTWKCTPGMAKALETLDEDMKRRGSEGLRLTEVFRAWAFGRAERAKWDLWVAHAKPEPGTKGFDATTMRTTYVAPPGEGNHFWGGAFDHDVDLLSFTKVAPEHRLEVFWDLCEPLGFRPIIREPKIEQAESWHMDHHGTLRTVYDTVTKAGGRDAYAATARVGCILTGVAEAWTAPEWVIQARLLAGGFYCGTPDGVLGRLSRDALKRAGFEVAPGTRASEILDLLTRADVGGDVIRGL